MRTKLRSDIPQTVVITSHTVHVKIRSEEMAYQSSFG